LKNTLTTTAILILPAFVGPTSAAPVVEMPVASLPARISAFHASLVRLNAWSDKRKNEDCRADQLDDVSQAAWNQLAEQVEYRDTKP
jgi:hypothetical protein